MINPKNNDENNDVTIAGTDLFADSESFLNELTDDELQQVRGGRKPGKACGPAPAPSNLSLLLCG
ncbi:MULTISPECIES: bacteriocin [unclassified Microcoleus]|uniref:bacteriocin n=1 Tax=unclassified Microcoleus TaxID=2642155 RepID=UPI002FD5EE4F